MGEIVCEDAVTAVATSSVLMHNQEDGTESVVIAYGTEKGYIGVGDLLIEKVMNDSSAEFLWIMRSLSLKMRMKLQLI